MVAAKTPAPTMAAVPCSARAEHEHRQGDQRGEEARTVADAVGNFLPAGLRPMRDGRYGAHKVSFGTAQR